MISGATLLHNAALLLPLVAVFSQTGAAAQPSPTKLLPGFRLSPWFGEQVSEERTPEGINVLINAPGPDKFDTARPTLLVLYTTPNGNNIEQTMGAALEPGVDWHFDIQHVAAQIRRLREVDKRENVVVACLEADGKSWPAWRQRHANGGVLIRDLVEQLYKRTPGEPVHVALTGHSGGGSFIFGLFNSGEIPDIIDRIATLDANYSFDDEAGHGERIKTWLAANQKRRLIVVAYDDRNITLDGKPVLGPTGGTFRASHRMLDSLGKAKPFTKTEDNKGLFSRYDGLNGQALIVIHKNPENKILHTALVGEMNGLLFALTEGTPEQKLWGTFGGPRAYTQWIQPADIVPAGLVATVNVKLPERPASAPTGSALLSPLLGKLQADIEADVIKAMMNGDIPAFLRKFKTIQVDAIDSTGVKHSATFEVMPDYLAVGSDTDFVRMPLTPASAEEVAIAFDCSLPTRKMVDDIYRHAEIKLAPIPLMQDRELLQTFIYHNTLIEAQLRSTTLGLLTAGDKKDVVITNRLQERAGRVAIYGWHRLDGIPIQPLTIVHKETYVDYSHGIRLVRSQLVVDGKPTTIAQVLKDPVLNILLSDEGPIAISTYSSP